MNLSKRFFLNTSVIAVAIILITGCSKNQPKTPEKMVDVSSYSLNNSELNNLIKYTINEDEPCINVYEKERIGNRYYSNSWKTCFRKNYDGKINSVEHHTENLKYGLFIHEKTPGKIRHDEKVSHAKYLISTELDYNVKKYIKFKLKLNNEQEKLKKRKLDNKIYFIETFNLNNKDISKLRNKVNLSYIKYEDRVFEEFKKYDRTINTFEEYYNKLPLIKIDFEKKQKIGRYTFHISDNIEKPLTLSNINGTIKYKINTIEFNYIPEKFIGQDSFVKVIASYQGKGKDISVTIENKTKSYMNIKALSVYYGEDITQTELNYNLSPLAKKSFNIVMINNSLKNMLNTNHSIEYGMALNYQISGTEKMKNLLSIKKYSANKLQ